MEIAVCVEWGAGLVSVLPHTDDQVTSDRATNSSRNVPASIWISLRSYIENWGAALVIAILGLVAWEVSVRLFEVQ